MKLWERLLVLWFLSSGVALAILGAAMASAAMNRRKGK